MYGSPFKSETDLIQRKELLLTIIHKRWSIATDNQLLVLTKDNFDYQAQVYDMMGQKVVHELRTSFAEEKIKNKAVKFNHTVEVPKNWFEYFKQEKFSKWLLKRFPVKMIKKTFHGMEIMDLSFYYPELELPKMKPDLKIIAFGGFIRKDEEGNQYYSDGSK